MLIEKLVRDIYKSRAPGEIQPLQWSILRFLERAETGQRTVGWISRYLGLTPAPVSRALNTLSKRGLVASEPNPEDARSRMIWLTPLGKRTVAQDPLLELAKKLRALPEADRLNLQAVLQTLVLDTQTQDREGANGDGTGN